MSLLIFFENHVSSKISQESKTSETTLRISTSLKKYSPGNQVLEKVHVVYPCLFRLLYKKKQSTIIKQSTLVALNVIAKLFLRSSCFDAIKNIYYFLLLLLKILEIHLAAALGNVYCFDGP